ASLTMLYNALLSLTAFMFCLSLFLVHRASVLENDFRKLQGDIMLQLNQPRSEGVNGKMSSWTFIAPSAIILNKCVLAFPIGNITVIPWTISAQQGSTISQKKNRIVVQEDGYYLVFGQVLCHSNSTGTKSTHSGTVYLLQGDELELVIPDRPGVLISTDPESTFFGVIQLN
uniref:Tumor necrosis factor ligand superfamily member 13B-like n=1 Tax=Acanthochromis polyacanthus TaxID=80966 RepID=A0A3Q1F477_9TELE